MNNIYKLALGVSWVGCFCCGLCIGHTHINSGRIHNPVYVTAAHIDSSTLPGYTLLYSDTERDTAYYLDNNYEYHYPNIGDEVVVGESKFTVTAIQEDIGFYISCNTAYKGMSGARILDSDGNIIGFVSSSNHNNELLCIPIS